MMNDKTVMTNDKAVQVLLMMKNPEPWEPQLTAEENAAIEMAVKALKAVKIEPLTDIEQRIFLAAMSKEEVVAKKIDNDGPKGPDTVSLTNVCMQIIKKVKKSLWTN